MRDQTPCVSRAGSAVQRAATLLGGRILIGIASVLALVAVSVIAGTLAFAAGGWPAFFMSFGIVLAAASLGIFVRAWFLIRSLREPEVEVNQSVHHPPVAQAQPPRCDEPEPPSPPQTPIRPESLLAMAALTLGAAAVVGPVRLARIGLRAFSLWTTARTILQDQRSPPSSP